MNDRLAAALADRYRIERELGQGGMATVYLAEDLKHKRRVALKVLKPELAAVLGAERFVQEITTTAALQHPHILPLFDSGEANGFLYYVMPFIDGETLRTRLDRETQLGVDEAVRITSDVADALQYAHEHGVIHRDIKPENILLANGRPMVADFGIALALSAAAGGRMTETGLSLGTPHYMSPEQATAEKDITARSDVYSLASVCYEMLAGQPPHLGGSAQQIIMKIIAEPVAPVTQLRRSVPPNVADALAKALEKLPADRFASARAFSEALANPAYTHAHPQTIAQRPSPTGTRRVAGFATAAIAVTALVGAYLVGRSTGPDVVRGPVQFLANVPDSLIDITRCCGLPIALSPDGRTLVFVGMTNRGTGSLYRLDFDQLNASVIPGTEEGASPFFSPDGEWLGFEAAGTIKKVRLAGGPAETVAVPGGSISSATWTDRDQIVYAVTPMQNTLFTVNATGQDTPVVLRRSDTTRVSLLPYPIALPGGRAVLSAAAGGRGDGLADRRIVVVSLETGQVDTLGLGTNAAYANGYLFIGGANGTLSVQPFDAARLVTTGERTTILGGLTRLGPWMQGFTVSAGGSIAYLPSDSSASGQQYLELMVTELDGATNASGGRTGSASEPLSLPSPRPSALFDPAISPDGNRVLYRVPNQNAPSRAEAVGDLHMFDLRSRTTMRFTSSGALGAVWTPDGKHVAYFAPGGNGAPRGIFMRAADLSGAPELVVRDGELLPSAWTPDGRLLLTKYHSLSRSRQIGIVSPGDSAPRWIFPVSVNASQPVVSADGQWLAYTRDSRIWMQPMDRAGEPIQISVGLGEQPRWSRTGRTLYYIALPERTLVAARFTGATVSGRTAISAQIASMGTDEASVNWDIFPDGKRAIFTQPVLGGRAQKLAVVHDWPALVRAMAGRR